MEPRAGVSKPGIGTEAGAEGSVGPKQPPKCTELGLRTGFTDPFPPTPHLHKNAPLGCPHVPRDSWQLPDDRLIGGWQQRWG